MELSRQNYVDKAEDVIKTLKETGRSNKRGEKEMPLTTSKLRNLLSITAGLKTDAQHSREEELNADMRGRVQYLKMRIAYEAGRDNGVKSLVDIAELLNNVSKIGKSKENLLVFCDYMEALTAYHRYYGGRDS